MSEMPSDPMDGFPEVPMQDMGPPVTGRTFWDVVSGKGILILAALLVLAAAVALILLRDSIDWEPVILFLKENWMIALGPLAGWILGRYFARVVHRPECRVLISLDTENHTIQALLVPEGLFRHLNQAGNNVVYHSPAGNPVYLANSVDLSRGVIDYGWVHEHDAIVVFTKEKVFDEWHDTLDKVMEDNLKMMDIPEVYGLQFAGKALKRHLDRAAAAVGVDIGSSGGPSDYRAVPEDPEGGGQPPEDPEQAGDGE